MSGPEIECAGEFQDHERAVLGAQFSRCRIELIRRATHDRNVSLITWSAPHLRSPGPAPLRALPAAAVYVLRGQTLTRVENSEALEREFGEPVGELSLPGLRRPNPILDGAREALRGLIPWR